MLAWICATAASMRVILFESVACEVPKEVIVAENVQTVSMRAMKSLVVRVMYYGAEGIEACGTDARAKETGGGTSEVRAGGSQMCSAIGDKSPRGLSSVGSSSSDPRMGRWKDRGLARNQSIVRVVSQPRRRSNRGSTGNPICSRI